MIYPSEILTKRYYFVESGVIYKIANSNDSDECGSLPGYDENGKLKTKEDFVYVGIDGEHKKDSSGNDIKVTVVDYDAYEDIYPNIRVKYKRCSVTTDGTKTVGTKVFTKYLWLDNLIEIGDKYSSNKFSVGAKHGKSDTDFNEKYKRLVKEFIVSKAISNGTVDPTVLKSGYPYYVRDTNDEKDAKYVTIDGWIVEIQEIRGCSNLFNDDEIMTGVEDYVKNNALASINKALKPFGKQPYTTITLS